VSQVDCGAIGVGSCQGPESLKTSPAADQDHRGTGAIEHDL
jgi:hypothetical protein